jgi:hypothetical protein
MNKRAEFWVITAPRTKYYGRVGDTIVSADNKKEIEEKIEKLMQDLSMCDDCDPIKNPMCGKCLGA